MRRIFLASALASPLLFSAAALATPPATDAITASTARPLSTGIKPARVVSSTDITLSSFAQDPAPQNAAVVLSLNVDESGNAQDVQVVKSANHLLDAPVAAAVRQFRFRPALLDNKAVASDMTLTVFVQR
jgi:TonB family protein